VIKLHSVLELDHTIQCTWVDNYSQNVFWATFQDSTGRGTHVCLDLRNDSATQSRLFEKARYPTMPEAVLLELGGEEEGIVIPLISRWLDSEEPHRVGFRAEGLDILIKGFLRVGESVA
jgi:hypothetical protein